MDYLHEHDDNLRRRLVSIAHFDTTTENDELVILLTMEIFREHYVNFLEKNKCRNPHFHFWWQYMQMVGVRLMFIRVKRDGI